MVIMYHSVKVVLWYCLVDETPINGNTLQLKEGISKLFDQMFVLNVTSQVVRTTDIVEQMELSQFLKEQRVWFKLMDQCYKTCGGMTMRITI